MKTTTISNLAAMKANGEKFAVITAYDFTFSKLIETAAIEVVLVGDSLGNVVQGRDSTLPVTIDDMAYHTEAVKRGNNRALLMTDMPFMSYATEVQALDNAAILMQAGAQMVKLEGGAWLADTVYLLSQRGHLAYYNLKMLIINLHTLQTVYFLNFVHKVLLYCRWAFNSKNIFWCGRTITKWHTCSYVIVFLH